MKKVLFVLGFVLVSIAAQSCCTTVNCPGVSSVEMVEDTENC